MPRKRAPWSLSRRLVLGIVALLALMTVLIGIASTLALQGFLIGRLDDQLESAKGRIDVANQQPDDANRPPQGPPGAGFLGLLGGPGTVAVTLDSSGEVTRAGVLNSDGQATALTAAEQSALLAVPPSDQPYTVNLGATLGDYRLIAIDTFAGTEIIGFPLSEVQATVAQLEIIIGVVTVVGIAIAAFASAGVVRIALRPLARVTATATKVSEIPLDRGEVALAVRVPEADADPRTEVGQLGSALNTMLVHVAEALTARQQSEAQVRQFVADASHELRTPLASIRGYAELTRRGDYELPEDVRHAIGRVESEATRMTSLVEDLLLLARLDAARPLDSDPVDLSRLLVDAVSDAHAAAPDHQWELDLPETEVVVAGDAPRLHQVVANLLANARVHTPPGTTVTASLAVLAATRMALIEVADDGPGISEQLMPELFTRFVRGDESRARGAGSTGLGLSIVQAVVASHHGTVEVASRPGKTVFSVRLPLA